MPRSRHPTPPDVHPIVVILPCGVDAIPPTGYRTVVPSLHFTDGVGALPFHQKLRMTIVSSTEDSLTISTEPLRTIVGLSKRVANSKAWAATDAGPNMSARNRSSVSNTRSTSLDDTPPRSRTGVRPP